MSSGLSTIKFHFMVTSSRNESTAQASLLQTSFHCRFMSWSDKMCKWNWPFTGGNLLLTLRERGSSPFAWLDEYKLTYSPSPPSSFAHSLYRKRGGTQAKCIRERRGAVCFLWVGLWLRQQLAASYQQDHQVALECIIYKLLAKTTCSAKCN